MKWWVGYLLAFPPKGTNSDFRHWLAGQREESTRSCIAVHLLTNHVMENEDVFTPSNVKITDTLVVGVEWEDERLGGGNDFCLSKRLSQTSSMAGNTCLRYWSGVHLGGLVSNI